MKKIALIIIAAAIAAVTATGKVARRALSIFQPNVPETETIASETMEFVYDYSWCNDTTGMLEDNFTSDRMLLQIGPEGLSKFSSYKNLTVDSLLMNLSKEQLTEALMDNKLSNGEFMTIFKNYPADVSRTLKRYVSTGSVTKRICRCSNGNLPTARAPYSVMNVTKPNAASEGVNGLRTTPRKSPSWTDLGNSRGFPDSS